jgi:hypothetical protein
MKILNPFTLLSNHINTKVNMALSNRLSQTKEKEKNDKVMVFECTYPPNKLFISISNEWSPIMLVEVVDYLIKGYSILPIIKNIEDQETYIGFTKLIPYTEPLISIIKPLNPFERYSIVTGTDITDKKLIIDKVGVENELSLEEFIESANQWEEKAIEK